MGLCKAIVLVVFNVSAFVLFMASCGTSWLENTSGTTKNEYTLWRVCTTVNGGDASCKDLDSAVVNCDKRMEVINADRAFTLISTILVGLLTIVSVYRIFNNLILIKAFIIGKVYVIVGLFALAFGIFNWIAGFALYSEEYCGTKLADNSSANKIGPSAPAAFVASCIWLVSLILECILSDVSVEVPEVAASEEKKEETSKAEPTSEEPANKAEPTSEEPAKKAETPKEAAAAPAAEEEKKDE